MERKNINRFMFTAAVLSRYLAAIGTAFFKTIFIAADAKTQLKKVIFWLFFIVVIHHHTSVIACPALLRVIPSYHILYRARNMLLLNVQQVHAWFNSVAVSNFKYVECL